jgi:hypothetical protein
LLFNYTALFSTLHASLVLESFFYFFRYAVDNIRTIYLLLDYLHDLTQS